MCDFDEQPLIKGNPDEKICELGNLEVVNHKGETIKTFLKPLKIVLLVGKQLNNVQKSGYGINHIYYKHFKEIPKRFHSVTNNEIDPIQTIINFLLFFLHDSKNHLEITLSSERDTRPLLIRSPYGRLVLAKKQHFYQVMTFMTNNQRVGTFIGYYKSNKSSVEILYNRPYNIINHKELDRLDDAQLVEGQVLDCGK